MSDTLFDLSSIPLAEPVEEPTLYCYGCCNELPKYPVRFCPTCGEDLRPATQYEAQAKRGRKR